MAKTTVSLREVARRAGCSPAHVLNLVRLGILGRRPDVGTPRPAVIPADLADALAESIRGGLATQPVARLMADDPDQVLVLAQRLQELARAQIDRRDAARREEVA